MAFHALRRLWQELDYRDRLTLGMLAFGLLGNTAFIPINLINRPLEHAMVNLVVEVFFVLMALAMRRPKSRFVVRVCFSSVVLIAISMATVLAPWKNIFSPWSFLIPLIGFVLLGGRGGLIYSALYAIGMVIIPFGVATERLEKVELPERIDFYMAYMMVVITAFLFERIRLATFSRLEHARQISENERRRFQSLFDGTRSAMVIVDASGRMQMANQAFGRIFGPSAAAGTPLVELIPELGPLLATRIESVRRLNSAFQTEEELSTRSGRVWFFANYQSMEGFGDSGAVQITWSDIQESHRARDERDALNDRLRQTQKMEAIGTLAGGVAHDINNRLAAMLGCVQIMQKPALSPVDREKYLAQLETSVWRAAELTGHLLTFSRQGRHRNVRVSLKNLGEEVRLLMTPGLPPGVSLVLENGMNAPTVLGDPAHVQSAVLNLLFNARDAMEGRTGEIRLSSSRVELAAPLPATLLGTLEPGPWAVIEVRDGGSGIPAEVQARMFEPFYTTKKTGTGMGLAAVYGMVTEYGGDLAVESEIGKGTCFRLYLRALLPASTAATGMEDAPDTAEAEGLRLLFVEDEEPVRTLMGKILDASGYQVTLASGGSEAVSAFARNPEAFDLVVSDMQMPELSGLGVFQKVRGIRPGLPFILSSGYAVTQEISQILSAPGTTFLPKPWGVREFDKAIKQVMRRQ